jgi:hypothetical protein
MLLRLGSAGMGRSAKDFGDEFADCRDVARFFIAYQHVRLPWLSNRGRTVARPSVDMRYGLPERDSISRLRRSRLNTAGSQSASIIPSRVTQVMAMILLPWPRSCRMRPPGPERATHVVRCVRYAWVSRMTDVKVNYSAMSRIAVLPDQKPAVRPISTPESASPCFQEWPGGRNSHLCAQLVPHFPTFEHTTSSALRSMLNFEHVPSPKHGPIVMGQRER